MMNDSQRIDLIRTMAGDAGTILLNLFKDYRVAEPKEKERLTKIIDTNIKDLEKEIGEPVADFYKNIFYGL